jgi:FkbM family methyltransferase
MQLLLRKIRHIIRMPYRTIARRRLMPYWYRMVFRLVFGRWPNADEKHQLAKSAQQWTPTTLASSFRAVLNLFDQQSHPTAFAVRITPADVQVVEYAGVKIAIDATDPVISHDIEHGFYEWHMIALFRRVLRPGMRMVDLGANIGLFSLLAAKLVGEEGRVYSIEPRGENVRLLLYSTAINHFNHIQLLPTAVGANVGYTLYQTHIGANGGLLGQANAMPDERVILQPTSQVVPMTRLDDLVEGPIDVLKLDIEGAEGMAMRGALELIRRDRPIITSEASMEMLGRVSQMTLRDYLLITRDLGYRQFVIGRTDGQLTEATDLDQFLTEWPDVLHIEDFVFVPAEKMSLLDTPEGAALPQAVTE